jgi:PTH1 family peptidyl-tRNA hydrolase
MKIICGLGNPEIKYKNTRHNIGFMVIDSFKTKHNFPNFKQKFKGLISIKNINYEDILLLKPQTGMNISGISVLEVKNFYQVSVEDIIVIHDEIDTNFGDIRTKKSCSSTHNGIRSIVEHCGKDFHRIRVGIGRDNSTSVLDYVLGNFRDNEQELLIELSVDKIEGYLK